MYDPAYVFQENPGLVIWNREDVVRFISSLGANLKTIAETSVANAPMLDQPILRRELLEDITLRKLGIKTNLQIRIIKKKLTTQIEEDLPKLGVTFYHWGIFFLGKHFLSVFNRTFSLFLDRRFSYFLHFISKFANISYFLYFFSNVATISYFLHFFKIGYYSLLFYTFFKFWYYFLLFTIFSKFATISDFLHFCFYFDTISYFFILVFKFWYYFLLFTLFFKFYHYFLKKWKKSEKKWKKSEKKWKKSEKKWKKSLKNKKTCPVKKCLPKKQIPPFEMYKIRILYQLESETLLGVENAIKH